MALRLVTTAVLLLRFANAQEDPCVDGVDNAIHLENIGMRMPIRFYNVTLLTYNTKMQPLCGEDSPPIQFPGYLKIASGEMEVVSPVSPRDGNIKVDLSLTKNSVMIGKICEKGISKNYFVQNGLCNFELCPLLGKHNCELLEKRGKLSVKDMFPDAPEMIYMGPLGLPYTEGEWKAEARFTQDGHTAAGLRYKKHKWVNVEPASETVATKKTEL